jgi:ribonuclease HI
MVTYGAIIWAHKASIFIPKFERLQRLALMGLGHFRKSTPTAGLEVIFDLIPLDIYLNGEAAKTFQRISGRNPTRWDGIGTGKKRGHLFKAGQFLPGKTVALDTKVVTYQWVKNYSVDITDDGIPIEGNDITCYTDGSLIDGNTGWGFCISDSDLIDAKVSGYLGTQATVFQAEVFAIDRAARYLTGLQGRSVIINVDSQAALLALKNPKTSSRVVEECKTALNKLGHSMDVKMRWVKAHVGHAQNELADELAKKGAQGEGDYAILPVPLSSFKQKVKEHLVALWETRWKARLDCRQSKVWFPTLNKTISRQIIRQSRPKVSRLVQFITGHNYLNYHMSKTAGLDPLCRLCEEQDETAEHIALYCPCLWLERVNAFQTATPTTPTSWDVKKLTRFMEEERVSVLTAQRGG